MRPTAWRIRKDPRFEGKWVIFAPGYLIREEYVTSTFERAVSVLPVLQRSRGRIYP